ncbi:hypothetical protein NBRC106471_2856 [Acetobacter pasteurianus subsp. pasteurianus LMG 1262 = NBRC 106471]|nr:hypothetical protein NBRC106471_2856 [Acetobacter pasteurianus subsp. pasteurianus LMG 1262 = NBRC 106471]
MLSESVSVMGGSKETVFSATPQKVTVPVLIVANQDDRRGNLTEGLYIGLDYEKVCFAKKKFP